MTRNAKRAEAGFTLIEILISILLMMILLLAVTMIFMNTTETVAVSEARSLVYTNARYALDFLQKDLMGCVPFATGRNRFIMLNGKTNSPPASDPTYNVNGNHFGTAADKITFRTTTMVGDALQMAEVTFELIPGNKAIGSGGAVVPGNNEHAKTVRTNRPLYTLVRRVRVMAPGVTDPTQAFTEIPKDSQNNPINDMELCHYVISFNLEYFANNETFSNLEPSYFTEETGSYDPLGNGMDVNDTAGNTLPDGTPTPLRVPAVRATIVIVEDRAERQERLFTKEIWIPGG